MVLSVSEKQYEEFQKETKVDPERQAVLTIVKNEWPDTKQQVPLKPRPYWTFREEAARGDGLLFKGTHLIALKKFMRPEMLRQIHKSHLGIAKCTQRAREVLFWPGMSVDVQQMVTTVPPSFPWQKIGTDLFELQGEHYLLSVCYRSKFPEVTKMESLRSSVVAEELTRQFGAHGIPAEVVSDNGPHFSSSEFQEFAKEYGFKHVPSSPHNPMANGEVEWAVQTLKTPWRKNSDKYRALLDYQTTPIPDLE